MVASPARADPTGAPPSLGRGPAAARRSSSRGAGIASLALGASLARRGVMPAISMIIAALTAVVLSLVAVLLALRGREAPVNDVPLIASSAIAWGGGFLQAFAVAAHALRRDRTDGIFHLLASRSAGLNGYVAARVGGLAAVLAAVVGGGTLLTGLVAVLASARLHTVAKTTQATIASLAFALAFAAVVAPVAFAALGARSRVGGYLFLLGVVVFPDVIASALSDVLPPAVTDVLSIPSALAALRAALAPGTADGFRFLRALVALALFAALAFALVRREAVLVPRAEDEA